MAADIQTLRLGDVVRYDPPSRWCRDGYAIVGQRDNGSVFLADTYWSGGGGGFVRPESWEVLFNLADYEKRPLHVWETFAEGDRRRIPCHHGHRTEYLVRKGAVPDLATQIANAEERVANAESDVRSAQRRLDYEREQLAALRAESPLSRTGQNGEDA